MKIPDRLAIQAATAQINLINYVIEHPHQPVPTAVIRGSIDATTALWLQNLAEVLQSANCLPASSTDAMIDVAPDTDPNPDKAA